MHDRQHGLCAGFGCAGHIVRQRTGELDLKSRHVTDGKAKDSTQNHHPPKMEMCQSVKLQHTFQFAKNENKWNKKYTGVEVVVVGQLPDISIHHRHHFLCVDGIERYTETGNYAENDACPRKGTGHRFLVHTQPESTWRHKKQSSDISLVAHPIVFIAAVTVSKNGFSGFCLLRPVHVKNYNYKDNRGTLLLYSPVLHAHETLNLPRKHTPSPI